MRLLAAFLAGFGAFVLLTFVGGLLLPLPISEADYGLRGVIVIASFVVAVLVGRWVWRRSASAAHPHAADSGNRTLNGQAAFRQSDHPPDELAHPVAFWVAVGVGLLVFLLAASFAAGMDT